MFKIILINILNFDNLRRVKVNLNKRINMRNILERANTVLLLVLIILIGFNLYTNLTGYANANVVLNALKNDYLYTIPSEQTLREGQIKGLVQSIGDQYAEYIPKAKAQEFNDSLNQRYQGIGVSFNFKDANKIFITKVFENSPAQKSGLVENDILLKVDNQEIANLSQQEIVNKIRGEEGSIVKITIFRTSENKSIDFDIKREKVNVELVTNEIRNNKAMISIRSFGDNVSEKLANIAKAEIINNSNIDTIILNLTDNPGGILEEGVNIISMFVNEEGKTILKEKTKRGEIEIKSVKAKVDLSKYKIKILVNENSASASEIVAISLQELKNARLYGSKTYGKGVVQKISTLSNGDLLKYTIAEWLSPNGKSINKEGVKVDEEFDSKLDFVEKVFETN
jgi:carboxyl-terminal processing protease